MLTLNSSIKALREAMSNMSYDSELYEMYNGYINIKKEKNKAKYQQEKKNDENRQKGREHLNFFYSYMDNKKNLIDFHCVDDAGDSGIYVSRIYISEELFNYRISNGTYVRNGVDDNLNSQSIFLYITDDNDNNYVIQETRNYNHPIPDNIKEAYEIRKNVSQEFYSLAEHNRDTLHISWGSARQMARQIMFQRDPNMDAYHKYHIENTY